MRTESIALAPQAEEFQPYGALALRWALFLIFLWFGCLKFIAYEVKGIAPEVMNSPLLVWAYKSFGQQGISMVIGVIEIAIGLLIALRPISSRWSGIGSLGAFVMFLITITLLLLAPGGWHEWYGSRFSPVWSDSSWLRIWSCWQHRRGRRTKLSAALD